MLGADSGARRAASLPGSDRRVAAWSATGRAVSGPALLSSAGLMSVMVMLVA